MRLALAQINSTLGDFKGNAAKILAHLELASKDKCDLIVFPEASLFGYHPVDLLERESIVDAQLEELRSIHKKLPRGLGVLVGAITKNQASLGKPYCNSAVYLEKGSSPQIFSKQLLPTYDVFDEERHIEPGDVTKNVLKIKGKKILVTICEDIWGWKGVFRNRRSYYPDNPLMKIKPGSVDLVVNLSASPFTDLKLKQREKVVGEVRKRFRRPVVYLNMVGAQDELIFDGHSFLLDSLGKNICQLKGFQEDYKVVDLSQSHKALSKTKFDINELRRSAIVLGIRDFISKTGFSKIHLGLSGGIDSALVAYLAAEALGAENVTGLSLPGPFTANLSQTLATDLARNLKIELIEVDILKTYDRAFGELQSSLGPFDFGVVNENLQARLRAIMLMAFSNKTGSLLLNTSNKSELATGYSTIYGDLCGGLSPIGDLLKTQVFDLAKFINRNQEIIPNGIIERPPSAELRPDQKDEDSLPPYSELDRDVTYLVQDYKAAKTDQQKWILNALMKSEFKRWQAPPVLKISDHAFGRGRRFPIAHRALF